MVEPRSRSADASVSGWRSVLSKLLQPAPQVAVRQVGVVALDDVDHGVEAAPQGRRSETWKALGLGGGVHRVDGAVEGFGESGGEPGAAHAELAVDA